MTTTDPDELERPLTGFRASINRNSKAVATVSVLILIACVFYLLHATVLSWFDHQKPILPYIGHQCFAVDLTTGKIIMITIRDDGFNPVLDSPNSNLAYPAIVFSCGDCKDVSKRFVGYVESLTPEAKAAMKAMREQLTQPSQDGSSTMATTQPMGDPMMFGRQIMDPKKGEWLTMDSPGAGKLIQDAMSRCGAGKYPTQCFPEFSDYDVAP